MNGARIETLAMLAVAASGAAWGLYWIPLRALDAAGITGVWAIVLFYVLPALLLLPVFIMRRQALLEGGWSFQLAGILAGTALVLYAGALVFTDVVRALLFYYLTPLWSTLLARIVLGETITWQRWVTMAVALAGLLVILNVGNGFSVILNAGDWMGLASGVVWAIAAVTIKSDAKGNVVDFVLGYFFWGSIAALTLTLLPLEGTKAMPDWPTIQSVLVWIVPVVAILAIPSAFGVMWGATVLSPGLLAILFMTEISAGAITAAIWAGEPFGWREVTGILLISAAGLFEPAMKLFFKALDPDAGRPDIGV